MQTDVTDVAMYNPPKPQGSQKERMKYGQTVGARHDRADKVASEAPHSTTAWENRTTWILGRPRSDQERAERSFPLAEDSETRCSTQDVRR